MTNALIIENDRNSIEVLELVLGREGVNCTSVERPADLQPGHAANVDVVFLDLDMPGMDGYEVYDILRNEYHVGVPIVAYTVNTNEMATTRDLGFNGMIAKPLDSTCFSDQLKRLLAGHAVWEDC